MNIQTDVYRKIQNSIQERAIELTLRTSGAMRRFTKTRLYRALADQRGDVPGWVLVVLMTTGLVTAIWTIAAPRLTAILKSSLDSMNGVR